ncbi:hypothetical protein SAMN05421846_104218 [Chryseobacterium taeanense]|uniref:Lipoprotein n=1 Tax=Chryseobacterium taeanense TaxID=311334 RepID=A0A1G8I5F6_9FLAO|nr:hypothetical protein [Chryseobacterium taeanense]SDI14143.1 hypothetical protein SAMN05421846_104218 [Chryseobacterium taeanense]
MKKLLKITAILMIFILTACKHQAKEETSLENVATQNKPLHQDKITKDIFTDEYGEELEVALNETQNTITVRLAGKTYDLKKRDELPDYTASDANFQYSDIRGEVTFLNKDYNMVLFHHRKSKISTGNTRMASY